MTRILAITAIVVAVSAVIALAAAVGLDLPKFATQQHVADHAAEEKVLIDRLAQEVQTAQERSLINSIESNTRQAGYWELQAIKLEKLGESGQAARDQAQLHRRAVERWEQELRELN